LYKEAATHRASEAIIDSFVACVTKFGDFRYPNSTRGGKQAVLSHFENNNIDANKGGGGAIEDQKNTLVSRLTRCRGSLRRAKIFIGYN